MSRLLDGTMPSLGGLMDAAAVGIVVIVLPVAVIETVRRALWYRYAVCLEGVYSAGSTSQGCCSRKMAKEEEQ